MSTITIIDGEFVNVSKLIYSTVSWGKVVLFSVYVFCTYAVHTFLANHGGDVIILDEKEKARAYTWYRRKRSLTSDII